MWIIDDQIGQDWLYYTTDGSDDALETKVCQEWEAGKCNKGEKCRFRHPTKV